jgi:Sulfatase-modifying factor enzyme 1
VRREGWRLISAAIRARTPPQRRSGGCSPRVPVHGADPGAPPRAPGCAGLRRSGRPASGMAAAPAAAVRRRRGGRGRPARHPTDAVGPRAVEGGFPARLTACLVATILTSVVSMSTARRSWLVDLGSWSPLGPQAPTPHPRPARPSVTGDAGALWDRDDPGVSVPDDVRGRQSRTGDATACRGATSRGGEGAVAREGRPPVATASSSPVPLLPALRSGAIRTGSTEHCYAAGRREAAADRARRALPHRPARGLQRRLRRLRRRDRSPHHRGTGGLRRPAARRSPPSRAVAGARWWRQVPGASWQRPEAATSDFAGREDPPVVKVSWLDAREYCRWTSTPAGTCGSGVPTGSGASARVNGTCAGVRTSATNPTAGGTDVRPQRLHPRQQRSQHRFRDGG